MITEAYCSFEVAKLLKEKGFDVPCNMWFVIHSNGKRTKHWSSIIYNRNNYNKDDKNSITFVSCPTHQMAMAWLREEKGIRVLPIDRLYDEKWSFTIHIVVIDEDGGFDVKYVHFEEPREWFDKYEQAVEAALKYVLTNLI